MDAGESRTLDGLGEQQILDEVFARLGVGSGTDGSDVLVGPGDDTALLRTDGAVLATTDTMVRGQDWLDRWSGAADVGAKVVVQNLADLAAMGGVGTGVLITLVAPGDTPVAWASGLADFAEQALHETGVSFCTRHHFGRPLAGEDRHYIRFAYSGIDAVDIRAGLTKLQDWVASA